MKILRVASDLYPAFVGGLALHVHELSDMQGKDGNEVTVYTSVWTDEPLYEQRENYDVIRFKGPVVFRNSITPGLFFKLLSEADKYDVVHAHSQLYCSTLFCAIAKRIKKFPLVITNHGVVSSTVPFWIHKIYMPTVGKFVLRSADCVISYTEEDKMSLIQYGAKPSTLAVIHNGIKLDKFLELPASSKKKQILWIGKHVPGKGGEYMITAFSQFSKTYPEYSLLMIGKGPLKDQVLSQIDDLGLSTRVTMIDFVPNDELPAIYAESMVFVLSSLAEGIPKTLLEAMVCGLPVISTNIPHLVSLVDDCGIVVPMMNSTAISEALVRLIENPKFMAKCGVNGRERILKNYDWGDTVIKTTVVLEKVVSNSGGNPS